MKGYVGEIPKTAWVVDYPIFERVYYDLVAGFNVFGNVTHQLSTRLYMDYLRMESEDLFLSFLPPDARESTRDAWYEGAGAETKAFLENRLTNLDIGTRVTFRTSDPKSEMLDLILAKMAPAVRGAPDPLNRCEHAPCARKNAAPDALVAEAALRKLTSLPQPFVRHTPDLSLLRVRTDKGGSHDLVYTLIHNKAHFNVAFMFFEQDRRDMKHDTMTIVPGFLGSYPNFFFDVKLADIGAFVSQLAAADEDRRIHCTGGEIRYSPQQPAVLGGVRLVRSALCRDGAGERSAVRSEPVRRQLSLGAALLRRAEAQIKDRGPAQQKMIRKMMPGMMNRINPRTMMTISPVV